MSFRQPITQRWREQVALLRLVRSVVGWHASFYQSYPVSAAQTPNEAAPQTDEMYVRVGETPVERKAGTKACQYHLSRQAAVSTRDGRQPER